MVLSKAIHRHVIGCPWIGQEEAKLKEHKGQRVQGWESTRTGGYKSEKAQGLFKAVCRHVQGCLWACPRLSADGEGGHKDARAGGLRGGNVEGHKGLHPFAYEPPGETSTT